MAQISPWATLGALLFSFIGVQLAEPLPTLAALVAAALCGVLMAAMLPFWAPKAEPAAARFGELRGFELDRGLRATLLVLSLAGLAFGLLLQPLAGEVALSCLAAAFMSAGAALAGDLPIWRCANGFNPPRIDP